MRVPFLSQWVASRDPGPSVDSVLRSLASRVSVPQRYSQNRARYLSRRDHIGLDDLKRGFIAGNEANAGDMDRFALFCLVFDQILREGLKGDVAELGVYKGNTAYVLAAIARHIGTTAYFLETYAGFSQLDMMGIDADKRVEFDDVTLEAVRKLVGNDNTRDIQGRFPETASRLPDGAAFCLVHIDCDLYSPAQSTLAYFYPRTIPGGVLLVHDYSSLHWSGIERAVDEFFADKPESPVPIPDQCGTIVVRKAKPSHQSANWFIQRARSGFANRWIDAANDGLADLLVSGWSGPEDWGVWGVGKSHILRLPLSSVPASDIEIEADVQAVILGTRTEQHVDVLVGSRLMGTWNFTLERNRGIRAVQVPAAAVALDGQGPPTVIIEFRPHSVASPHVIDPASHDTRELGLGLIRLRGRTS